MSCFEIIKTGLDLSTRFVFERRRTKSRDKSRAPSPLLVKISPFHWLQLPTPLYLVSIKRWFFWVENEPSTKIRLGTWTTASYSVLRNINNNRTHFTSVASYDLYHLLRYWILWPLHKRDSLHENVSNSDFKLFITWVYTSTRSPCYQNSSLWVRL